VRGVAASLHAACQKANAAIFRYAKETHPAATVGTTCSALVLQDGRGYSAHVGDSRIYRISRSYVWQLTDDHSTVGELVKRHLLSREEARTHPSRSVLNRALGVDERVEVDSAEFALGSDEYYLLCTDGLTTMVEETEMQAIVLSLTPQRACDELVRYANEHGGKDNVTVLVIQVKGQLPQTRWIQRLFAGQGRGALPVDSCHAKE